MNRYLPHSVPRQVYNVALKVPVDKRAQSATVDDLQSNLEGT